MLCVFVCFFISFLYAEFIFITPISMQPTLHDSPLSHSDVDNVTQGFPHIDACCWIELVFG